MLWYRGGPPWRHKFALANSLTSCPFSHFAWPIMFRRIRRVKRISTNLLEEYSKGELPNPYKQPLLPDLESKGTQGKLLRLWLRSPWEDYTLVRPASTEPFLASRQGMYFHRATIYEFPNSGGMQLL